MNKYSGKILIVDDDEFVLLSLKILLQQNKEEVITLSNPERISATMEKEPIGVVLLDMNFRQGDTSSTQGLYWLRKINEIAPEVPVVLMTAYGEISLAVEAMKQGAHDFVAKPWQNEKLIATINGAHALYQEKRKVKQLTSQQKFFIQQQHEAFIGNAPSIQRIRR